MTHIRDAEPADLSVLRAIDIATHSVDTSPGPPPDPERHHLGNFGPGQVLVAESEGGRIQGYTAWGHPTPLPSSEHVMQIQALAVDPRFQGEGVGRALIRGVLELARHREATKVSLRVLGTNVVARRLYSLAGFVVEGVLRQEFELENRLVDDILMAHYLDGDFDAHREVDAPRLDQAPD
ncbi:GNAT family N-acetyltransferase [Euzebya tangerina]|uniref:GNAT family N-acetyltransferase n=1 Tax=Euzebya tangerina TaxID=591198 RepID=UPI0013C34118|nr:N-acetyltransferase [Euzebya tangerina]